MLVVRSVNNFEVDVFFVRSVNNLEVDIRFVIPFSSTWARPFGGKFNLRSQEGHFLKIALNPVLILPDCRSRRELSGSVLKSF